LRGRIILCGALYSFCAQTTCWYEAIVPLKPCRSTTTHWKAFAAAQQTAERDHADDSHVSEMLQKARDRIDRIKGGHQLRCGEP
jgi:hypothetical protein